MTTDRLTRWLNEDPKLVKVSWISTTCVICGQQVALCPLKVTWLFSAGRAGELGRRGHISCHSSVDFIFFCFPVWISCTNEWFCRTWGHVHFNSPFVEITFYNSLFIHVQRSFLDVVKVLYSDQICRTGTVNKITYTLSAMAAFFFLEMISAILTFDLPIIMAHTNWAHC